ncbi:hypothetical protein [Kitasatospora sp. NPDC093102]|uniref:hypothetical protein n=1 Tax=Kitasatospora sp. NPDC093102 TaxID=3155069 RepID=UPI00344717FE
MTALMTELGTCLPDGGPEVTEWTAAEAVTYELVSSWLRDTVAESGTHLPDALLPVPPVAAAEFTEVARGLATQGLESGPLPEPSPGQRRLAEAMVLDEHPSAGSWTPAERRAALDWTTLIVHRFGEDGVQRLIAALGGRSATR